MILNINFFVVIFFSFRITIEECLTLHSIAESDNATILHLPIFAIYLFPLAPQVTHPLLPLPLSLFLTQPPHGEWLCLQYILNIII